MPFIASKNIDIKFLDYVESVFKFSLPKSYSRFLLKYGSFYASYPNYIEFDVNYLYHSGISIETVFGQDIIDLSSDLLYEIEDYVDAIIIGRDAGSNFFLLDKATGHILYWDKGWSYDYVGRCASKEVISYKNENSNDNEDDSPNIFLLFESFTELEAEIFKSITIQKAQVSY